MSSRARLQSLIILAGSRSPNYERLSVPKAIWPHRHIHSLILWALSATF